MTNKERMEFLVDLINEADYNYHVLDNPTITDNEYEVDSEIENKSQEKKEERD